MTSDERTARRLIRLLLQEHGYAAVVQLVEEEAGDNRPKRRPRRVLSHRERAERAAAELVRERARRIVGDD